MITTCHVVEPLHGKLLGHQDTAAGDALHSRCCVKSQLQEKEQKQHPQRTTYDNSLSQERLEREAPVELHQTSNGVSLPIPKGLFKCGDRSASAALSSPLTTSSDGALVVNIRALLHRGRFPMGQTRLPLPLTNQTTKFVAFRVQPPHPNRGEPNWDVAERVAVYMLCYKEEHSTAPTFEIPLTRSEMVARTCSELGPCLYLSTSKGIFEFQCQNEGRYNYYFWERQMALLGVRLIMPHDLFVPTSTQPIGEGSFAKVYVAIHRTTGRPVVIKRVPKDKLASLPESHLSAVHIEIDILRKLNHPFVVQFKTAFEDECYYYIVLEKLSGGTVNDWLRQHKCMTEAEARGAMSRILTVLTALQSHNIVHRDLKLENLVLEDPANPTSVKVIDFGLAAYLDTPRMGMYCGSPGFVAPEIINKHKYGKKVDLFSAGVLLYAFLSGKTPFHSDGDTASETLYKNKVCHVTFDSHVWKHVSPDAKRFITRLLTKDPTERFSVEEALAHPWLVGKMSPASVEPTATERGSGELQAAAQPLLCLQGRLRRPAVGGRRDSNSNAEEQQTLLLQQSTKWQRTQRIVLHGNKCPTVTTSSESFTFVVQTGLTRLPLVYHDTTKTLQDVLEQKKPGNSRRTRCNSSSSSSLVTTADEPCSLRINNNVEHQEHVQQRYHQPHKAAAAVEPAVPTIRKRCLSQHDEQHYYRHHNTPLPLDLITRKWKEHGSVLSPAWKCVMMPVPRHQQQHSSADSKSTAVSDKSYRSSSSSTSDVSRGVKLLRSSECSTATTRSRALSSLSSYKTAKTVEVRNRFTSEGPTYQKTTASPDHVMASCLAPCDCQSQLRLLATSHCRRYAFSLDNLLVRRTA